MPAVAVRAAAERAAAVPAAVFPAERAVWLMQMLTVKKRKRRSGTEW